MVLDEFEREWTSTSGDLGVRMDKAFAAAADHFSRQAPVGADPDFPDAQPAAVLLAAAVAGQRAELAWIGGDVGLLVREAVVIGRTRPHTLAEKFRDERSETPLPHSPQMGICSRLIGPSQSGSREPSRASWALAEGDVVLLTSQGDWRQQPLDSSSLLHAVTPASTLEASVDAVAEVIAGHGDPPFSAVAGLGL